MGLLCCSLFLKIMSLCFSYAFYSDWFYSILFYSILLYSILFWKLSLCKTSIVTIMIHRRILQFYYNLLDIYFWPYGSALWSKFLAFSLLFIRPSGFGLPTCLNFCKFPQLAFDSLSMPRIELASLLQGTKLEYFFQYLKLYLKHSLLTEIILKIVGARLWGNRILGTYGNSLCGEEYTLWRHRKLVMKVLMVDWHRCSQLTSAPKVEWSYVLWLVDVFVRFRSWQSDLQTNVHKEIVHKKDTEL